MIRETQRALWIHVVWDPASGGPFLARCLEPYRTAVGDTAKAAFERACDDVGKELVSHPDAALERAEEPLWDALWDLVRNGERLPVAEAWRARAEPPHEHAIHVRMVVRHAPPRIQKLEIAELGFVRPAAPSAAEA